ncbi:MAG TPA: hypothetical protein VGO67_01345 [Verrucomicrobiae bacterium]|jgi:hypothetical protein
MSKLKFLFLAFLAVPLAALPSGAQTYLGVEAVLRRVEEMSAKTNADQKADEQDKLRGDLKTFIQNAPALSPADSAKQWLDLVDRAVKTQLQQR